VNLPGGAKLVSGAAVSTAVQHSMIFGRVDDASIITGIQQACAELRQCSGGATAVGSPVAGSSSNSAHSRAPFTPGSAAQEQQQQQQREAAAAAAAVHKSVSEPVLQQWASDGLQPLGEPSWARLGRQQSSHHSSQQSSHPRSASRRGSLGACDREQCTAGSNSSSSSSNAHGGSGSAGGGDAGKSTVSALECDLKNTARLYPPGR
jgi:hypothetical protein